LNNLPAEEIALIKPSKAEELAYADVAAFAVIA
jgi:hypothetical protein